MPYEKTRDRLEEFIAKALDYGEIRDGAIQAELEKSELRERFLEPGLEEKAPKIWEAAASEIEAYNQVERVYEDRLAELRREEARMRQSYLRMPQRGVVAVLVTLSPVILLLALMLFLSFLTWVGLLEATVTLAAVFEGSIFGDLGITLLLAVVLFIATASLAYVALSRNLLRQYSASKARYDERLAEIQRELETHALAERLGTAAQEVERAVIERGILQELRSIINAYSPSYETSLTITSAPGLAEVFDPAYEIPTDTKDKLERLLTNMPGGSIGISGPRGVGKTTLLGSFCGKASTTTLKKRPVLSVMISAPVKYDPREFILHIFSSVCHRVLELKNKARRKPWGYMEEAQKAPITFFSTVLDLREALAVILLGLFLMSTALMSILRSNLSDFFLDFFLDFFFGLGVFLIVLGVVGMLLRVYQVLQQRRHTQLEKKREQELYGDDPLVIEAYNWLREIQFQQSYSSGWAGALKANIASVGVETSVNNMIQLAEKQRGLPEIVDHYQQFIKNVSNEYEVIIGIDELDKIGSDEDAQRFLNEIKSQFGLESCFYLISVSESAMSSFERRGLPFRDVFDSSFDAIVHADYLSLDKSQRLLRRRVIGVPVPFLDFCHCMVGGLPRDLIRTFRALYDEHEQRGRSSDSNESELSTLCNSLIRADLRAKLRATSIAAKDIMLEPEVSRLFERLRELERVLDTNDSLSAVYSDLLQDQKDPLIVPEEGPAHKDEPEEVTKNRQELASLSNELEVYLYYSATLLEFFTREDLNEAILKDTEDSGELEQLARARQFFAISPRIAKSSITDFRIKRSMDVPEGLAAKPA